MPRRSLAIVVNVASGDQGQPTPNGQMREALAYLALQEAQDSKMWGLGRDPNQGTVTSTILWNTSPPGVIKSPGGPGNPDGGDDLIGQSAGSQVFLLTSHAPRSSSAGLGCRMSL